MKKVSNGLFQRPTGGYFIRRTVNGRRRFLSLQGITTEAGAKNCALLCDMAVAQGTFDEFAARFERKVQLTIDEALSHWLRSARTIKKNKAKVIDAKERSVTSTKPFVSIALNSITLAQLESWVAHRNRKVNETTVFDDVSRVRQFFRYCCEQEWIDKNPAKRLKSPKPSRCTKDASHLIMKHELESLSLSPAVSTMAWAMWHTGLRISEVYRVQAEDIHEAALHVRCDPEDRTKSARARTVPLSASAHARLRLLVMTTLPSEHVVRRELKAARKGLVPITPHGFRHSRASIWAAEHVPLVQIQHWLGHHDQRTTQLYIHPLPALGCMGKLRAHDRQTP